MPEQQKDDYDPRNDTIHYTTEAKGDQGFEEFQSLKEHLEDMEDLLDLRKAKEAEGKADTTPLHDLMGDVD